MSALPPVHHESFTVRTLDADAHGALSVGGLLDFMQEAAGAHAARLGVSMATLLEGGMSWMLNRLMVEVHAQADLHDEITVETWPTRFDRLYAGRDFVVRRGATEIAVASSRWVVVSLAARRATRIPARIRDLPIPKRDPRLAVDRPRPGRLARVDLTRRFEVRRSDLDPLQHVNNVRYAEWVAESVPDDTWATRRLTALDIVFRAEARYGDTVSAQTEISPESFKHALVRDSDGTSLVLASTTWDVASHNPL